MNNSYLQSLTARLSAAIDQNYDVINMEEVLSVIAALEGATLTKEQLESTKLAKNINHVRRRTKDEHLARCAKTLLKKWREMVGLTQAKSTSVARNQNANVTIATSDNANQFNQQYQNHQLLNQQYPPQPLTIQHGIHLSTDDRDSKRPIGNNDYMRTTPTVSSTLTRSANVYNTTKRLENIDEDSRGYASGVMERENRIFTSTSIVPTVDVDSKEKSYHMPQKLSNFNHIGNDFWQMDPNLMSAPIQNTSSQSNGKQRNTGRKFSAASSRQKLIRGVESLGSHISEQLPHGDSNISINSSVVIDIQDSNSGSNIIEPIIKSPERQQEQFTSEKPSPTKPRKSRKEKRRKERESIAKLDRDIPVVIIDDVAPLYPSETNEPTRSLPNNLQEINDNTIKKERSNSAYPMSNISEILSLSNSSMSSIFPGDGTLKLVDDMKRGDLSVSSNRSNLPRNLSSSDLSFAGKFKSQLSTSMSYDNENSMDVSVVSENSCTNLPKKSSQLFSPNKLSFGQSNSSGIVQCNSNDSTSNSRASHLDVVDVIHQENHQVENLTSPANTLVQPTAETGLQNYGDTNASNVNSHPEVKVPKKRGRKKGSKGVDSVIAKEASLSSQMLMSSLSGSKKVKTTKELYAELGIVTSTSKTPNIPESSTNTVQLSTISNRPTRHMPLPPDSSCSDSSLQSPRTLDANSMPVASATTLSSVKPTKSRTADVADSESESMQSELSTKTGNDELTQKNYVESADSNSAIAKTTTIGTTSPPKILTLRQLEKQLQDCYKRMPPVRTVKEIEDVYKSESILCTCQIVAKLPTLPNEEVSKANTNNTDTLKSNKDTKLTKTNVIDSMSSTNDPAKQESYKKQSTPLQVSSTPHSQGNESKDSAIKSIFDEDATNPKQCDQFPLQVLPSTQKEPRSPVEKVKSIFDIDFDEDDDPLISIKADAAILVADKLLRGTLSNHEQSSTPKEQFPARMPTPQPRQEQTVPPPQPSMLFQQIPLPVHPLQDLFPGVPSEVLHKFPMGSILKAEEDPNCQAKKRFLLQTQDITPFHVNALHNCYIPNVNGNWDNGDCSQTKKDLQDPNSSIPYSPSDAHNYVVPRLGTFRGERLTKKLSQVNIQKCTDFQNNQEEIKQLHKFPFLGMAPRLEYLKLQEIYGHSKDSVDLTRIWRAKRTRKKVQERENQVNARIENAGTGQEGLNEECTETNCSNDLEQLQSIESGTPTCSTSQIGFGNPVSHINNENLGTNMDTNNDGNGDDGKTAFGNGTEHDADQSLLNFKDNGYRNLSTLSNTANTNANTNDHISDVIFADRSENETSAETIVNENTAMLSPINRNDIGHKNLNLKTQPDEMDSVLSMINNEEDEVISDKNSSRRNSCSSTSSLKQTQNSINMRLKQHRELERTQKKLLVTKRKRQDHHNKSPTSFGKQKSPRIKRIKIAINGDVATHRQIWSDSSTSSSSDECSETEYANNEHDIETESDDGECNLSWSSYANGNYDSMEIESGKDVADDEELQLDSIIDGLEIRPNTVADMDIGIDADGEGEDEDDNDIDNEFPYYEGYEGDNDYHEIVQRDMPATTSHDSKRIVLTIKKTPSKINSISNVISSTSVKNESPKSETLSDDIKIQNIEPKISIEKNSDPANVTDTSEHIELSSKTAFPVDQPTGTDGIDNTAIVNEVDINAKNMASTTISTVIADSLENLNDNETNPQNTVAVEPEQKVQNQLPNDKYIRRRRRVTSKSKRKHSKSHLNCHLEDDNTIDHAERPISKHIKTHQKLFFPYELYIYNKDRSIKDTVLDMSSCSSDCGDSCDDDDPISVSQCKTECDTKVDQNETVYNSINCCTPTDSTSNNVCDVTILLNETKDDSTILCNDDDINYSIDSCDSIDYSELFKGNNGKLLSFNNIYPANASSTLSSCEKDKKIENDEAFNKVSESSNNNNSVAPNNMQLGLIELDETKDLMIKNDQKLKQEEHFPNENCDEYNNLYNNNNNNNNINSLSNSNIKRDNLENNITYSLSYKPMKAENGGKSTTEQMLQNANATRLTVSDTSSDKLQQNDTTKKGQSQSEDDNLESELPAGSSKAQNHQQSKLEPHKEYRLGVRSVDEDVQDDEGNTCARIQQFREWHEVLQLRSYDDELLTVLPYVVIE